MRSALAIAMLPTLFVSLLAQAYIGSDAKEGAASVEADAPVEGDSKATVTSPDCGAERPGPRGTERTGSPPPPACWRRDGVIAAPTPFH